MLLASKFTLGSVQTALNKYGKDLSYKETKIKKARGEEKYETIETKFFKPENYEVKYMDFKMILDAPVVSLHPVHIAPLVKINCTACGSVYRVELHHIRKINYLNPKLSLFDKLQVKLRRKQMPLCSDCHMKLHHGE
jgi:hypothetical protein